MQARQGWDLPLQIPWTLSTPHCVNCFCRASRALLEPECGAVSGDSLAVPLKETECPGSCLAAIEALKYLELETTDWLPGAGLSVVGHGDP